jgi:hypothetical protein
MVVAEYCACGSGMEGDIKPDSLVEGMISAFWQVHSGPECAPTTRENAKRAERAKDSGERLIA